MLFHEHSAPRVSRRSGRDRSVSPGRALAAGPRFRRKPGEPQPNVGGEDQSGCRTAKGEPGCAPGPLKSPFYSGPLPELPKIFRRHPQMGVVARDGIEPPTPAFSGRGLNREVIDQAIDHAALGRGNELLIHVERCARPGVAHQALRVLHVRAGQFEPGGEAAA